MQYRRGVLLRAWCHAPRGVPVQLGRFKFVETTQLSRDHLQHTFNTAAAIPAQPRRKTIQATKHFAAKQAITSPPPCPCVLPIHTATLCGAAADVGMAVYGGHIQDKLQINIAA
jgi:hypothetical protein